MNESDKRFIETTVKKAFDIYQETRSMRLTPEDNVRLKDLYFRLYGRHLTGCSVCVIEAIKNLLNYEQNNNN